MGLRVYKKPSSRDGADSGTLESTGREERGDNWGSRLAKLIPAEALGLHGTLSGLVIAQGELENSHLYLWAAAAASLALCILVRYQSTKDEENHKAQWMAILIAAISFCLWLWALPGEAGLIEGGFLAAFIGIIWGAFIPFIYRGDEA